MLKIEKRMGLIMLKLQTLEDTNRLASAIGAVALAGDNLVLTGDLGTGKTTLTKGIAKSLGIHRTIKSPTYTIIREYLEGKIPLYHMDVYRVENGASDLGLDEYFEGDGLCVIEWGNLLQEALPLDYLELTFKRTEETEQARELTFSAHGKRASDFQKRILERWSA